ncbi:MAG: nucleotidyltransferase domain-containing protein [Planctomycetaceae bacterium]|jgi:predicted nucleotidyltransferase|nr:nucleotidyltransferase domain-containing protein [Planctomycetaceae bacterium]
MDNTLLIREIQDVIGIIKNVVNCEKIYLFGSRAYGNSDETSDFDIYVVLSNDSIRPLEIRRRIYKKLLANKINKSVDILAGYACDFKSLSELPSLERKIVREGILVYEQK